MYDLWFTIGTAITDTPPAPAPAPVPLIMDIMKASPAAAFTRLQERDLVETIAGGAPATVVANNTTCILLVNAGTTAVRQVIAQNLATKPVPPPPISIFAAGKICQLLVLNTGFTAALVSARTAYTHLGVIAAPSAGFIAMLGLCLIDPTLSSYIKDPTLDPSAPALIAAAKTEFRLSNTEWVAVQQFVGDPAFIAAKSSIFGGLAPEDPWQYCCGEQYLFWDTRNERAVI